MCACCAGASSAMATATARRGRGQRLLRRLRLSPRRLGQAPLAPARGRHDARGGRRRWRFAERLLQRGVELLQRAASGRRAMQAQVDRLRELAWQVTARARERADRTADAPRGLRRRRAADRIEPAQRLVQHERQRVHVDGLARLAALALLRRHVGERAEHVAGAREHVLAAQLRAAEVGQLGHAAERLRRRCVGVGMVRDEHVVRLDVAMDHAARMGVRERGAQRPADRQHLLVGQRVVGDQARQRVAVDQLGDQVEGVLHGARLVQRDDRRVRQARARERLARDPLGVLAGSERDALDGHVAVQLLVVRAPDHAEAARAEALAQAIAAEHQRLRAGPVRPRLAGARMTRLHEGLRVHRVLRSPRGGPLPPARGRRSSADREVAGWSGRWPAVILGPLPESLQGAAFVVLRRWRGDSAAAGTPRASRASAPKTASSPAGDRLAAP